MARLHLCRCIRLQVQLHHPFLRHRLPIDGHDRLVGLLLAPENQNNWDQRYNEIETEVEFTIPQNPEEHGVCILQEGCKLLAEMTSPATVRPQ